MSSTVLFGKLIESKPNFSAKAFNSGFSSGYNFIFENSFDEENRVNNSSSNIFSLKFS